MGAVGEREVADGFTVEEPGRDRGQIAGDEGGERIGVVAVGEAVALEGAGDGVEGKTIHGGAEADGDVGEVADDEAADDFVGREPRGEQTGARRGWFCWRRGDARGLDGEGGENLALFTTINADLVLLGPAVEEPARPLGHGRGRRAGVEDVEGGGALVKQRLAQGGEGLERSQLVLKFSQLRVRPGLESDAVGDGPLG